MRYNGDGYGDCEVSVFNDCAANGEPWATNNEGTGHPWPVLSGENAEYQVLAGNSSTATADLDFMLNSASGIGLVPEQVWKLRRPARLAVRVGPDHGVDLSIPTVSPTARPRR